MGSTSNCRRALYDWQAYTLNNDRPVKRRRRICVIVIEGPVRQGHSILITWNSAIIENTQDNISKSSVFIDADVLGCINMRHQTTFNALYSAPDEPCGCRNSHMHINEIFVSNDPAGLSRATGSSRHFLPE